MKFDLLKEKCEYYRRLEDDRLIPNMPLLIMVDGRSFSSIVKKKFDLPFDNDFIQMMNDVAVTLCKEINGCKIAYVQSDEISLYISDDNDADCFFGWRKEKLLSIIASIASARMTHLLSIYELKKLNYKNKLDTEELLNELANTTEVQFDCKCWNVPNLNEVFAWFLYRQNDCIRNSKQQTAQTYMNKKSLFNMIVDDQIEKLANEQGIIWYDFDDNVKYGRMIVSEQLELKNEELNTTYTRKKWIIKPCYLWRNDDGKEVFEQLIK